MKRFSILMSSIFLVVAFSVSAWADIPTSSPTGYYYQYAAFSASTTSYLGGGDVDAYGNTIYVNRDGRHLDVYHVTLHDTDGDGTLEPDQHPDNPSATGPMEQRTLSYVKTYNVRDLDTPTVGELYATSNAVYFLGQNEGDVYKFDLGSQAVSKVVDSSNFDLSFLGYDDVNNKWYAGRESERAVYSWDGSSWQQEFTYQTLAGSHMDGLEVVTDPSTNTPYVYVSDMTSNFLGQWRYDTTSGSWVEDNLFAYTGTAGYVEGLGFGALGHFWATTGFSNSGTLYEIGGGELGGYVPHTVVPVPAGLYLLGSALFGLGGLGRKLRFFNKA